MRGVTLRKRRSDHPKRFLLTRPMRGVTERGSDPSGQLGISTHTPHAGRDLSLLCIPIPPQISTHTPHAGRDDFASSEGANNTISTHTPHAGRDLEVIEETLGAGISTHTPHAGRD